MTKKAKHTPGPWEVERVTNRWSSEFGHTHPAVNGFRTTCYLYEQDPERAEADARLIAAAPDLANALKRAIEQIEALLPDYGSNTVTVTEAQAALEKAGLL